MHFFHEIGLWPTKVCIFLGVLLRMSKLNSSWIKKALSDANSFIIWQLSHAIFGYRLFLSIARFELSCSSKICQSNFFGSIFLNVESKWILVNFDGNACKVWLVKKWTDCILREKRKPMKTSHCNCVWLVSIQWYWYKKVDKKCIL